VGGVAERGGGRRARGERVEAVRAILGEDDEGFGEGEAEADDASGRVPLGSISSRPLLSCGSVHLDGLHESASGAVDCDLWLADLLLPHNGRLRIITHQSCRRG
jgi:hypothetical protein